MTDLSERAERLHHLAAAELRLARLIDQNGGAR